jgi:putative ABC transport system permease protein
MGKPNLSLIQHNDLLPFVGSLNNHFSKILFLGIVVFSLKFLLDYLLKTEFGVLARATGKNEEVVKSLGNNPKNIKIITLFVAGITFGIGAILTAQYQGFVDINGGIGNIIVGIASLMLGEALLKPKKVSEFTLAAIVGTIVYELIINIVLRLGLSSSDIKLFTALVVIVAIISRTKNKK